MLAPVGPALAIRAILSSGWVMPGDLATAPPRRHDVWARRDGALFSAGRPGRRVAAAAGDDETPGAGEAGEIGTDRTGPVVAVRGTVWCAGFTGARWRAGVLA